MYLFDTPLICINLPITFSVTIISVNLNTQTHTRVGDIFMDFFIYVNLNTQTHIFIRFCNPDLGFRDIYQVSMACNARQCKYLDRGKLARQRQRLARLENQNKPRRERH